MRTIRGLLLTSALFLQPATQGTAQQVLIENGKAALSNKYVQGAILGAVGYFGSEAISNYLKKHSFCKDFCFPSKMEHVDTESSLDVDSINHMIDDANKRIKQAEITTKQNADIGDLRNSIAQRIIVGTAASFLVHKKVIDPFAAFIFTDIWSNARSVKDVLLSLPKFSTFSWKKLSLLALGAIAGIARSTIPTIVEKYTGEKSPCIKLSAQLAAGSFTNALLTKFTDYSDCFKDEYVDANGKFDLERFNADIQLRKSVANSFDFGINVFNKALS